MTHKLDVLGVGYPSLDYIIPLNDEPSVGTTSLIISDNSEIPYYGGCAINIMYLLNHLGYNCGVSMTVGKDFVESGYRQYLLDKGINLDFVQVNDKYNTSFTKLLMSPDGEHTTLFYPGAMIAEEYKENDLTSMNTRYGLLAIGEINENQYFLKECIKKNIPTIFSMKGDYHSLNKNYLIEAISYSEIVFMNEKEFDQLNDYLPQTVFKYLEENENKIIVVTLGSKGSLVFSNDGDYFSPAYDKTKVVDTSGGGDAFIAGFLAEFLKGESLETAAITGTALASFIIEDYGCLTNIPSNNNLENRREYIKEKINNEESNTILRAYGR